MKKDYVSIAAAALTALLVGIGPAAAQSSSGQTGATGTARSECDAASSAPSSSPGAADNRSATPGGSAADEKLTDAISGAPCDNDNTNAGVDTKDQSPSASPPMSDDTRDRGSNQQQQIDKNANMDRG